MRRKSGRTRDEFLFGRSRERDKRATWRIYVDRASCNGQPRVESNSITDDLPDRDRLCDEEKLQPLYALAWKVFETSRS